MDWLCCGFNEKVVDAIIMIYLWIFQISDGFNQRGEADKPFFVSKPKTRKNSTKKRVTALKFGMAVSYFTTLKQTPGQLQCCNPFLVLGLFIKVSHTNIRF